MRRALLRYHDIARTRTEKTENHFLQGESIYITIFMLENENFNNIQIIFFKFLCCFMRLFPFKPTFSYLSKLNIFFMFSEYFSRKTILLKQHENENIIIES